MAISNPLSFNNIATAVNALAVVSPVGTPLRLKFLFGEPTAAERQ